MIANKSQSRERNKVFVTNITIILEFVPFFKFNTRTARSILLELPEDLCTSCKNYPKHWQN